MVQDSRSPTPPRNLHLEAQVDPQEFRGKGVLECWEGQGRWSRKGGRDVCGPTWCPCVSHSGQTGGLCRGAGGRTRLGMVS